MATHNRRNRLQVAPEAGSKYRSQEHPLARELRILAQQLGSPLRTEYDQFQCIWTARIGDFSGCGLDESDACASLHSIILARLRSVMQNSA